MKRTWLSYLFLIPIISQAQDHILDPQYRHKTHHQLPSLSYFSPNYVVVDWLVEILS